MSAAVHPRPTPDMALAGFDRLMASVVSIAMETGCPTTADPIEHLHAAAKLGYTAAGGSEEMPIEIRLLPTVVQEKVRAILEEHDLGNVFAQGGPAWEPQFDAIYLEQENLAVSYANEIALGSIRPDAVRMLEMARALFEAERTGHYRALAFDRAMAALDRIMAENPEKVAEARVRGSICNWFVVQIERQVDGVDPSVLLDVVMHKLGWSR